MRVRTPSLLRRAALAAAAILAVSLVHPAGAQARRPATYMPAGETVEPPYGYFDFCSRDPAACGQPPDESGLPLGGASWAAPASTGQRYWDTVFSIRSSPWGRRAPEPAQWVVVADVTADQWRSILAINRQVNREIYAVSDRELFSSNDFWTLPERRGGRRYGDCEDYVLEKRRELIGLGVPAQALSIAIARTPQRQVHAVLLLATPAGEFVLDNRSAWVSRWYETDYRWERRQVAGGQRWARVRG
jgi:predicted transglutaminase-like cysteine proteinase